LNSPFFSIIVPVYNRANFIALTINSCLKQSFENFELIIIDDGSKDNTAEVVSEIEDQRLKYVYQENSERGAARNHGVKLAKGEYVFFLDSDDLLDQNHLELARESIDFKEQPNFMFTGIKSNVGKDLIPINPDFGDVIDHNVILKSNVCACAFFLKREFALENSFEEDRNLAGSEDRLLLLEISKKTKLYYSNHNTYSLINHPDRSMLTADTEAWSRQLEVLMAKTKKNNAISSGELKIIRSSFLQMVAIKLFIARRYKLGFSWYWKSLVELPSSLLSKNTLRVIRYGVFSFLKKPIKLFLLLFSVVYLLQITVFMIKTNQSKRDFDEAIDRFKKSNASETIEQVANLVSSNFIFEYRSYKFYENPISFLVNQFHSGVSQVCDSRYLFEHSDEAFCGQQSKLIADFSTELGYDYRYVVFSNHVAIEVYYEHSWHFYDPTNVVFAKKDLDEFQRLSFFDIDIKNALETKKNAGANLVDLSNVILQDRNFNFFSKLEWFNRICQWIWYCSPPFLLILYFFRDYLKKKIVLVVNNLY